jgi:hypothetical protein
VNLEILDEADAYPWNAGFVHPGLKVFDWQHFADLGFSFDFGGGLFAFEE